MRTPHGKVFVLQDGTCDLNWLCQKIGELVKTPKTALKFKGYDGKRAAFPMISHVRVNVDDGGWNCEIILYALLILLPTAGTYPRNPERVRNPQGDEFEFGKLLIPKD